MNLVARPLFLLAVAAVCALMLLPTHPFRDVEGAGFSCGDPFVGSIRGADSYLVGIPDSAQIGFYGPSVGQAREVCADASRKRVGLGLVALTATGISTFAVLRRKRRGSTDAPLENTHTL